MFQTHTPVRLQVCPAAVSLQQQSGQSAAYFNTVSLLKDNCREGRKLTGQEDIIGLETSLSWLIVDHVGFGLMMNGSVEKAKLV